MPGCQGLTGPGFRPGDESVVTAWKLWTTTVETKASNGAGRPEGGKDHPGCIDLVCSRKAKASAHF
jgi:hypothetical protein